MKTCLRRHLAALAFLAALPGAPAWAAELVAVRVGRAETIADGAIENAVILVENGSIVMVGEDLEIERGVPVLDRPDWVAMPGLVNPYSRIGLRSKGSSSSEPQQSAALEVDPDNDVWEDVLAAGVTTVGLYPPGTGIPGQAVAVQPVGSSAEEMILREGAYLKVLLVASTSSKKMLRDGFEDADDYVEKEQKAREKYDKEVEKREKAKKSKKKKDDDEDKKAADDKKEEEEPLGPYVPPTPDPEVQPFLDLRAGTLSALFGLRKAADYLHLVDALGEEEISYALRVPLRGSSDLFEVAEKIGAAGLRVILEPTTTFQPTTRRDRNMPRELAAAGAKICFIPTSDSSAGYERWLRDVGALIKMGYDREPALRSMTLEPAGLLGLDEQIGSLEAGKKANIIFLDGDPFQPGTRVRAVMIDGDFVVEEKKKR